MQYAFCLTYGSRRALLHLFGPIGASTIDTECTKWVKWYTYHSSSYLKIWCKWMHACTDGQTSCIHNTSLQMGTRIKIFPEHLRGLIKISVAGQSLLPLSIQFQNVGDFVPPEAHETLVILWDVSGQNNIWLKVLLPLHLVDTGHTSVTLLDVWFSCLAQQSFIKSIVAGSQ